MKYKRIFGKQTRPESPPSRGAWIEIRKMTGAPAQNHVAPLAGGVD